MMLRDMVGPAWALFRGSWRVLLNIHLVSNALTLLVLTPLYSGLLGLLILLSGDAALTDEDILRFILSPRGWFVFTFAAAIWVTLLLLELSLMLLALLRTSRDVPLTWRNMLGNWLGMMGRLFDLACRMVLMSSALAAPFLLLASGMLMYFLGDYDLNYYLAARPPQFWKASAALVLTLLPMIVVLSRFVMVYLVALPMVLLESLTVREALLASKSLMPQLRRPIRRFFLLWAVFSLLLLALAGVVFDLGSGVAIQSSGGSLQVLAFQLGVVLMLWALAHFTATFLSASVLSTGLFQFAGLYDRERTMPLSGRAAGYLGRPGFRKPIIAMVGFISIGSVIAAMLLLAVAERRDDRSVTEIIAHRGASMAAPENTLAAVSAAIEQGAEWVEIDVQETSDGHLAVIHDRDLMKIAGNGMQVGQSELASLQKIDIGSRFGPDFATQRIPELEQVLAIAKGNIGVVIELKYYGHERALEQRVVDAVLAAGMEQDVLLMSLNLRGVRALKRLQPDWDVGLLSAVGVGRLTNIDVDFYAVSSAMARRGFVRRARQSGRKVMVWTVNDPALVSVMISRNVDGIITDDPAQAVRIRKEREELSLQELMLVQIASLVGSRHESTQ